VRILSNPHGIALLILDKTMHSPSISAYKSIRWMATVLLCVHSVSQARAQGSAEMERGARSTTIQAQDAAGLPGANARWRGRVELKRQNTSRGTPEESTKTILRIETFLDGAVEALRFDFAFPDEEQDFDGSPFHPRFGDIKARLRFKPWQASAYSFPSFVEVTFPTAHPESLGSGKVQLSAGVRILAPVKLPFLDAPGHASRLEAEIQQVNSIGGDPSRRDIAYTKFELTAYDIWRDTFTAKLKLKPAVDWEADGRTGAVAEVEGGMFFARDWRAWLMFGRRIWGPSEIASTYDTRVELGAARTF
jgi:hypothetical protein